MNDLLIDPTRKVRVAGDRRVVLAVGKADAAGPLDP
jgi:hypothetical protein